jgi:mRNA interferase RelE/StbE
VSSIYDLFLTNQAKKELSKIKKGNPKAAQAVSHALVLIAEDPGIGEFLHGDLKGRRKFRVGDYRIIYHAERKAVIVFILRIAHRKEAYRS